MADELIESIMAAHIFAYGQNAALHVGPAGGMRGTGSEMQRLKVAQGLDGCRHGPRMKKTRPGGQRGKGALHLVQALQAAQAATRPARQTAAPELELIQ